MNEYFLEPDNKAILYWETNNTKVIISSHGGILYGSKPLPSSVPFNLHFMVHGNRSTKGFVSSVAYMTPKEFETEKKGTSNIADHVLTYFPEDTQEQIRTCVEEQGYDVVTIVQGQQATLKSVLKALHKLHRYDDVYCLFCRVAVGQTAIPTVKGSVLTELKQKLGGQQ